MNVLIACEESQRVCMAFRKLGHEAYSCDIQEPSGGHPEWHILGDVSEVLNPIYICKNGIKYPALTFSTMDGTYHAIAGKWDLIIAHPPCTYLSNAGACRLYPKKGILNLERYEKGLQAKEFFMQFLNADCEHIAVENPIQSKVYEMPPYTQIIQPYEYGHPYSKKTCLWLKNLPELQPTNIVEPICSWVSGGSKDNHGNKRTNSGMKFRDSKTKSKTFEGIAKAMAEQWSEFLKKEEEGRMKRCYENYRKGKFENCNHCGSSVKGKDEYEWWCPYDGNLMKICGYLGMCGGIEVPEELQDRQLSLFQEEQK